MIAVTSVRGLAQLQDGGRRGHMHEGVPRGGAVVPELLARANAALGNAWDATAIEVAGAIAIEARVAARVATEDGVARALARGERVVLAARYVAIAGGFDVAAHLGGRGALVGAGIGAWLRAGDELRGASTPCGVARALPPLDLGAPIRVVAGPDLERFADSALATLTSSEYAISPTRDRTGARLVGPALARADSDDAASAPMARGAIQVPRSGEPIVLGPDHPTTGGYPVVAVVARVDLGRFAASERLRFRLVGTDEARDAWRAHYARFFFAPDAALQSTNEKM